MQRRLRSISAKAVSVILNYLTYFSSILDLTMGPLYITMRIEEYVLGIIKIDTMLCYICLIFVLVPLKLHKLIEDSRCSVFQHHRLVGKESESQYLNLTTIKRWVSLYL